MGTKILCFAGSLRRDSFNKKLAKVAAALVEEAGAEATYVDLKELSLPLYDGDLEEEQGLPENARIFKKLLKEHDGFLIASAEYNSSLAPALKNALDWASRPEPGEEPLACFNGKTAALLAASPGALGGLRGLVVLRSMLGNIKVLVLPEQFALAKAHEAFADDGSLLNKKDESAVKAVVARLVQVAGALKSQVW